MEISSKGNSYATFVSKEAGLSTITVSETSSEFAIINELSTMEGLNGSSFTFKVSVTEGYEIVCVKVNGVEITPNNDVYTATISGNTIISVETKVKGAKDPESIVSLTFPDENKANNKISSYEKIGLLKLEHMSGQLLVSIIIVGIIVGRILRQVKKAPLVLLRLAQSLQKLLLQ